MSTIRHLMQKLLTKAMAHPVLWELTQRTVLRLANSLQAGKRRATGYQERKEDPIDLTAVIRELSPDLGVLQGPFAGMKYPGLNAVCSSISPKLLGTYESELHPVIEEICSIGYPTILDIGCADGYYAVGLAQRLPKARLLAYDIDPKAREATQKMADLNGASTQLAIHGACDSNTLKSLKDTRALVVCDCEGYEDHLFTPEVIPSLCSADLLIEIHDFVDIRISTHLRERFKNTHSITEILSVDDLIKAQSCQDPLLRDFSLSQKFRLLAEYRPHIMRWFWCKSKNH